MCRGTLPTLLYGPRSDPHFMVFPAWGLKHGLFGVLNPLFQHRLMRVVFALVTLLGKKCEYGFRGYQARLGLRNRVPVIGERVYILHPDPAANECYQVRIVASRNGSDR